MNEPIRSKSQEIDQPTPNMVSSVLRRLSVAATAIAIASGALCAADTAKTFPTGREYEAVVVTAWQAPLLQAKPTNRLDLYRRTGGAWEQIPFQVDERKLSHDIANDSKVLCPLLPTDPGWVNCSSVHVVINKPPAPSSLPSPDGQFGEADELVFLAQDLGDQVAPNEALPASSVGFEGTYQEIVVRDPISGGVGYAYAFVHTGSGFPPAPRSYVRFEVPGACAGLPPAACGTVKAHPAAVSPTTFYWRAKWSGNWRLDQVEISGGAADLIDRWKGRADAGAILETENNWDTVGCPMFRGYSDGPVRLVRCIQGAQSGITTIKCEYCYPRYMETEIEWRVHDIDEFKAYFDYRKSASQPGNRLALDLQGYPSISAEDSIDGTPKTGLAPVWDGWVRVRNADQGLVEMWREGPERIKTTCSVDPACTGEDRVRAYLDDANTNDNTSSEDADESGAYGNLFLVYKNLLDNQDRDCASDVRFGRLWRRIVYFNSSDMAVPGVGISTDADTLKHREYFQEGHQFIIATNQLPGGGGGGPCLDVLWAVTSDSSGDYSQISISVDCLPPPFGWLLYRRLDGEPTLRLVGPLRVGVVKKDRSVKRGATYRYALRALGATGALGVLTPEKSVVIVDEVAPLPPGALQAVGASGAVSVSWGESGSSDSFKYNVYVAAVSGGPYTKLTATPIQPRSFMLGGVPPGQWRYVVVTAVDTSGNESDYSQEASAQSE